MDRIGNTPKTEVKYAKFWDRFYALWIDSFVLGVISSSFSAVFAQARFSDGHFTFSTFPSILIAFAYYAFFWINHNGQTIGKKLMGIKIIRQDNKKIDLNTSITRYIGYLISGAVFGLGYIWALFNPKRLTWHDKLAQTAVIVVNKPNKAIKVILTILLSISLLFFFGIIIAIILLVTNISQNPSQYSRFFNQLQDFGKYIENMDLNQLQPNQLKQL